MRATSVAVLILVAILGSPVAGGGAEHVDAFGEFRGGTPDGFVPPARPATSKALSVFAGKPWIALSAAYIIDGEEHVARHQVKAHSTCYLQMAFAQSAIEGDVEYKASLRGWDFLGFRSIRDKTFAHVSSAFLDANDGYVYTPIEIGEAGVYEIKVKLKRMSAKGIGSAKLIVEAVN